MTGKLKVAIIGAGIGKEHAAAYHELSDHFEMLAICDTHVDRARAFAATFDIPRVCTDIADACAMDDVDVIDICTPPHLHFDHSRLALQAGKHVICEKAIAGSLKEMDELSAFAVQARKRVMPIFQYRFGNGLQKLKMLVEEGIAGQAYLATAEVAWRRRADYYAIPWRGKWQTELGGALVTHAIHALDILCYILGPAHRVFARTATRVNAIEVEDCASVSLEMRDGSFASLAVTLGSSAQISRHRFCFANLTAESNSEPYGNTRDPWTFTGDSPELEARIAETFARFSPQPEGFAGQFARFRDALTCGAELPVTLADARLVLELLAAIYHSAQTGAQVELPIGREHSKYAQRTKK